MTQVNALIVDDSKAACAVLSRLLKKYEIQSNSVYSAVEAFEYLQDKTPDVIFMDHAMPDMDGLEAIKLIKAKPEWQAIPIYMFTARADNGFLEQVNESGALGVIPKTLDHQSLHAMLKRLNIEPKKELPTEENYHREQQLQAWLESFIENQIAPALSYRIDHSTRELREEILHKSNKMHRGSLQFHMQQQKKLVNQMAAERDYIVASYEWNQIKFLRRLSATLGLFIIIILAAGFYSYQYINQQHQGVIATLKSGQPLDENTALILAENTSIDYQQQENDMVSEHFKENPDTKPFNKKEWTLIDNAKQFEAELISYSSDFQIIQARTNSGYFFVLNELIVEKLPYPIYFLAQDCFGTSWIEAGSGEVFSNHNSELFFTHKDIKSLPLTIYSSLNDQGQCQTENTQKNLVQLNENDPEITAISDANFSLL